MKYPRITKDTQASRVFSCLLSYLRKLFRGLQDKVQIPQALPARFAATRAAGLFPKRSGQESDRGGAVVLVPSEPL